MEAFSRTRRGLLNAALGYGLGALSALAGVVVLVLTAALVSGARRGEPTAGGVMPVAAAALSLAILLALVVLWATLAVRFLVRRHRFRTHMDEAFEMERLAGGLNSRLVSALDFLERPEGPDGLMRMTIRRAEGDLGLEFEGRLDSARRNQARLRFGLLLAMLIVLGLTPWFGFKRAAAGWRSSFFVLEEALFPVVYEVTPAPGTHVRHLGDEVTVGIKFARRGYEEVLLLDRTEDQVMRQRLAVQPARGASHVLRGSAEGRHALHFEFGGRRSDDIVVIFADDPVLENMQTELVYPRYTRMLPRSLEGVQDRILALAGTEVRLGFTFSKELKRAAFAWDDGQQTALEVRGRYAYTQLTHKTARTATLQVEDVHGFRLKHPLVLSFEVQQDEPPSVVLPSNMKADMPMLPEAVKLFGFGVRVKDDFGVTRCVLKWHKTTVDDPTRVTQKGEEERVINPPLRNALVTFEKVFEHVPVAPGDKIVFSVKACDNRSPDPQESESPKKSFFVYQEDLDSLYVLGVRFGGLGGRLAERIPKSKRERGVTAPMSMRTVEKFQNEFDADIATPVRAPQISGSHVQAVKDYFRLMSTAVQSTQQEEQP